MSEARQHSPEALHAAERMEAYIGFAVPPDPLAGIVKPAQWHQATVGRRRSFLSAGDAAAYDAGYRSYPQDDGFQINTPFSTGYWDAEKRATVNA